MHNPGVMRAVGSRLVYVYLPEYMHGTLICILPDGRPLLYPVIRWESRERRDKLTGKVEVKEQLTYRRGYGRAALWYGLAQTHYQQASLQRDAADTAVIAAAMAPVRAALGTGFDELATAGPADPFEPAWGALVQWLSRSSPSGPAA